MAQLSSESQLASSPESSSAQPRQGAIVDRAGLGTNSLHDVRTTAPTGGKVPPQFGAPQIVGSEHPSTVAAAGAGTGDTPVAAAAAAGKLPPLPARPDGPAHGGAPVDDTATTTKNIADAWQAFNSATSPHDKEAALQRFRSAVSAADQQYKDAQQNAEKAGDRAASKFPGVGPHDFSQSISELEKVAKAFGAASAQLTDAQRDQIGPEMMRWSQQSKTPSSERQKIESEIRTKYPDLAKAMQQVRRMQEHYASFYAHGEQLEAQLKGTPVGRQDRSAFQSRIDARQALAFALRSVGRDREADAIDKQIQHIKADEQPLL